MQDTELNKELINILEALQKQINFINIMAIDHGCQIYALKSTDGSFMVAPLLVAKANTLVALAQLQMAEKEDDDESTSKSNPRTQSIDPAFRR